MGHIRRARDLHRRSGGNHSLSPRRANPSGRPGKAHSPHPGATGVKLLLTLLLLCLALPLAAQEPRLDDPLLEERARSLQREIRCVVCQNESIDSSQAGIARDLRRLVRERLVAGDSDEEIRDFLVARYGDYVLFRPPVRSDTWILWFGPAIVLLIGAAGIALAVARRRKQGATAPDVLKPEEEARLARLLAEEAGGKERRS